VTRVCLQDGAKDGLGSLAVSRHERGGGILFAQPLRIGEPCALEGQLRVRIVREVDERIAVRQPRAMMMRHFFQHPPHLGARLRRPAVAPVRACQVHARVSKVGCALEHPFERGDALGDLALLEQGCAQEPEAIHLARALRLSSNVAGAFGAFMVG
jgi:hypothetical protein